MNLRYLCAFFIAVSAVFMEKKQEAKFPLTVTVYRGVAYTELIDYFHIIFMCLHENVANNKVIHYSGNFLEKYRKEQIKHEEPISMPYPKLIRLRTGKPVLGDFLKSHGIPLHCNEYTKNFCTFEHFPDNIPSILVLDEDQMDCNLRSGLYKASVTLTPTCLFTKEKGFRYMAIKSDIQKVMEIKLTIHEFKSPLWSPISNQQSKSQENTELKTPTSLVEFFDDFCRTFNLK
jgi:hypothetical protein